MSTQTESLPTSVEVTLPDTPKGRGQLSVRYCDTCHRWGQRHSPHICGVNWHPRLDLLLREIATGSAATSEGRAAR